MFPPQVSTLQWPYLPTLSHLALALGLGLFIGLEREWRGKEAGVRTFGITALIGCLGGLTGDSFALLSLALLGIVVFFLNWQRLKEHGTTELTTSVALLLTCFIGVLCGKGHTFTPVVAGVVLAGLLTWKERLSTFATALTEVELRSVILLAILTFVVYPVLPNKPLDPWGLVEPRATWATIILIAGLGLINYILWKIYGTRGIELTGFFGGLVNSTVAAAELATHAKNFGEALVPIVYRGLTLASIAMLVRNGIILGVMAPNTLLVAALPLLFMALTGLITIYVRPKSAIPDTLPQIRLELPFSLPAALKFGLIFLAVTVAGTLAQRFLGPTGFYAVCLVGGLVSSASSVASAAILASHHEITLATAANGAILTSFSSIIVNWVVTARVSGQKTLIFSVGRSIALMALAGIVGVGVQAVVFSRF